MNGLMKNLLTGYSSAGHYSEARPVPRKCLPILNAIFIMLCFVLSHPDLTDSIQQPVDISSTDRANYDNASPVSGVQG